MTVNFVTFFSHLSWLNSVTAWKWSLGFPTSQYGRGTWPILVVDALQEYHLRYHLWNAKYPTKVYRKLRAKLVNRCSLIKYIRQQSIWGAGLDYPPFQNGCITFFTVTRWVLESVQLVIRVPDVDEPPIYSQLERVEDCNTTRSSSYYNGEMSWCSDTMGIYN